MSQDLPNSAEFDAGSRVLSVWTGWATGFPSPVFPPGQITLVPAEVRYIDRGIGEKVNLSLFWSPELRWAQDGGFALRNRLGIGFFGEATGPWQNKMNIYALGEVGIEDNGERVVGGGIDLWTQAYFSFLPGVWSEYQVRQNPEGAHDQSLWIGLRRVHWGIPSLVRNIIRRLD